MGSKCDVFSSSVRFLVLCHVVIFVSFQDWFEALSMLQATWTWVKWMVIFSDMKWGKMFYSIYINIYRVYSHIHSLRKDVCLFIVATLERIPNYRFD